MPSSTHRRRIVAGVDPKLLIVLGVLVVAGIAFFAWDKLSSGNAIAEDQRTFVCYFNQDVEVQLTNREVNEWKNRGDAVFPFDRRADPPTRVKCPDCGRLSCIERNPDTGEMPVLSDEWVALLESEEAGPPPSPMAQPN